MNRRRAHPVFVLSLAFLAAGCAARARAEGPSTSPKPGTIVVTQKRSGPLFVEGSVGYAKLTRTGAANALFEVQIPQAGLTKSVPPGAYRLVSYQRICTGNCGHLGPPSITCSTPLHILPGGRVAVTVDLDATAQRCTLSVAA